MRTFPEYTTASAVNDVGVSTGWKSPIPYLFGGLTLLLILVSFALLVLSCSSSTSRSDVVDQKPTSTPHLLPAPEMEPKIVVIMPGHRNPTFLAKPVSFFS
ncbi:protein GLUTAMINE DUMPER 5-like [Impatiens glandulifera]|uniref:protein GLUTAMINE DUMPER 5-like n=1 Tax=Impatiens glandulifera TaxID=253017 RepID=UPI001FB16B8A|nr:protein GLUTAMINE DUMPER 5-like [Impatiens glandulifera]